MKSLYMSLTIQPVRDNALKFPVVFKSLFGYNVMFRIGVIYNLTNESNYIFIMKTHIDLVDLSYWIRLFTRNCRHFMKVKKLMKTINMLIIEGDFMTYRSMGLISIQDYTIRFSGNYNIFPYNKLHGEK